MGHSYQYHFHGDHTYDAVGKEITSEGTGTFVVVTFREYQPPFGGETKGKATNLNCELFFSPPEAFDRFVAAILEEHKKLRPSQHSIMLDDLTTVENDSSPDPQDFETEEEYKAALGIWRLEHFSVMQRLREEIKNNPTLCAEVEAIVDSLNRSLENPTDAHAPTSDGTASASTPLLPNPTGSEGEGEGGQR